MNDTNTSVKASRVVIVEALLMVVCFIATALWLYGPRRGVPLGFRGQWVVTPNEAAWPFGAWLLPLGVLVLLGGTAALSAYDRFRRAKSPREQKNSTVMCIVFLALLALVWPWALLGPSGTQNLINSTWSDTANQYFSTSYQVENVRDFSRGYAQEWQRPPSPVQAHVATHPPGAVLFYYAARRVLDGVPPLQNAFSALAENLTASKTQEISDEANQLRRAAAKGAGAPAPASLPDEAVGGALWSAFLLSLCIAATVPAVFKVAHGFGVSNTIRKAVAVGQSDDQDADERTSDEIAGDERLRDTSGMVAAALFALSPAANLFTFTLDALIACLAMWALCCFTRYLDSRRNAWAIGCGALLALTTFISFGTLAVWGIVVLAALWRNVFLQSREPGQVPTEHTSSSGHWIPRALRDIGLCVAGFGVGWLILALLFPMQAGAIFKQAMAAHHSATVSVRTYSPWWWLNVLMFAVFCSGPVIVAAVGAAIRQVKSVLLCDRYAEEVSIEGNGRVNSETALALGLATLCTMILLTLSGNVRGEVERLWLFLLPPLCVLASLNLPLRSSQGRTTFPLALLMIGLQAVGTLLMAGIMSPLVRPY